MCRYCIYRKLTLKYEDYRNVICTCLQECSVFISGDGITEEIVRKTFGKFGPIQVATVDAIKG